MTYYPEADHGQPDAFQEALYDAMDAAAAEGVPFDRAAWLNAQRIAGNRRLLALSGWLA